MVGVNSKVLLWAVLLYTPAYYLLKVPNYSVFMTATFSSVVAWQAQFTSNCSIRKLRWEPSFDMRGTLVALAPEDICILCAPRKNLSDLTASLLLPP